MDIATATSTIHICGPNAGIVCQRAWDTHCALQAGNWAVLATETVERWVDPAAAAGEFQTYGAAPQRPIDNVGQVIAATADEATFRGVKSALVQAIDTWQRIQLGQFHAPAIDYGFGWPQGEQYARIRERFGADGAWPAGPAISSSWGIHSPEVPDEARVAYDIWKLLGGGAAGRDTITGKVRVSVNGTDQTVSSGAFQASDSSEPVGDSERGSITGDAVYDLNEAMSEIRRHHRHFTQISALCAQVADGGLDADEAISQIRGLVG